jgi:hypothetical protein
MAQKSSSLTTQISQSINTILADPSSMHKLLSHYLTLLQTLTPSSDSYAVLDESKHIAVAGHSKDLPFLRNVLSQLLDKNWSLTYEIFGDVLDDEIGDEYPSASEILNFFLNCSDAIFYLSEDSLQILDHVDSSYTIYRSDDLQQMISAQLNQL